jgi:hypothetical protein
MRNVWRCKLHVLIFRIFSLKKYFSLQWSIFSVFSLVSCRTTFWLIQPIHKIKTQFFLIIRLIKEKKVYTYYQYKIQVFFINTGFTFYLRYENYHFSLIATANRDFFSIPPDENKSYIDRKSLNILYLFCDVNNVTIVPGYVHVAVYNFHGIVAC